LIRELPKAELHVHIEGVIEPETKLQIAARNGIELAEKSADAIRETFGFTDLESFLAVFNGGVATLVEERDFYQVTREYLERVRKQNVLYAEMHFDPQLHVSRGVDFETFLRGMRRAQEEAERELGIASALIMAVYFEHEGLRAAEMLERSEPFREWIAAVGLYPFGEKEWTPPAAFTDVVRKARALDYRITAHCNNGRKESLETIRECVRALDVDRIDHGVHVLEDPALTAELGRRGICFTVCPTESLNRPGPRYAKELKTMLEQGLCVTANSDDPAYFLGRYLAEVLLALHAKVTLSAEEVIALERNAFASSFAAPKERGRYLAALEAAR
jgi:adenosine deaminase